jgi:transglutaminase-like putative cysteine protease
MEAERVQKAPASRVFLVASVLALTVVSAVGFGRIYRGTAPTLKLAAAAAAAVLLAALTERKHILIDVLVSAAGLVMAVTLLLYPDTTRYGLPAAATLRAMARSWEAVGRTAEAEIAPALPLAPLMLASLVAVWAAASSAHALAIRAASPFLAMLPTGALLAFASLVLEEGPRPLYVLAFLLAAIALLLADSMRRVGQWGPLTVWRGKVRPRFGTPGTLRGARRVALAAVAIALFVPGILPGFGQPGLVEARGEGTVQRVSINPIVDIQPSLLRNPQVRVFTVDSERPAYWRFLSLDSFTGTVWTSSDLHGEAGVDVGDGDLPVSSGSLAPESRGVTLEQVFQFDRLVQLWLPSAYEPVGVAAPDVALRYDRDAGTLMTKAGVFPGMTYSVRSRIPAPSAEDLDAVRSFDFPGVNRFLELPNDLPADIRRIAEDITRADATPFRKILAIQQHLRRFRYSESVEPGHDSNHILRFLTVTRAGYCEQFAGTMAVLLRSLGIPARVALGFTPGIRNPDTGLWDVGSNDAHAWVEVPFPGYGWLSFEPTPSRTNPSAGSYQAPLLAEGSLPGPDCILERGRTGPDPCVPSTAATPASPSVSGDRLAPEAEITRPADFRAGGPAAPPPTWWERNRPGATAGLALLLLVAMIPLMKAARRRKVLRSSGDPASVVLAAYSVFSERAVDVGLGRLPHETLWEHRQRLKGAVPTLDGDLDALTMMTTQAAYSRVPITEEEARRAAAAARTVGGEVIRSVGRARRMVGWFRVPVPNLNGWDGRR